MSVYTLDELVEFIRIGDLVEVVFRESDGKLSTHKNILLMGDNIEKALAEGNIKNSRRLWVEINGEKRDLTGENGRLLTEVIRVTFLSHSKDSRNRKRLVPLPKPPTNKPEAVERKTFRPIPRDPRTIGSKTSH